MIASFARAVWFMVLGSAFSIAPTDDRAIACIHAFCLTHGVFDTIFRVTAVIICPTSHFLHTDAVLAELEGWTAEI
jgi:hypothetical protein